MCMFPSVSVFLSSRRLLRLSFVGIIPPFPHSNMFGRVSPFVSSTSSLQPSCSGKREEGEICFSSPGGIPILVFPPSLIIMLLSSSFLSPPAVSVCDDF